MKLHEVNCTCRVCQHRRIAIEQHFGRGDQRYRKRDHHNLVEAEEDSPPISPPQEANKEGPSSSKNKEWAREFDD